MVYPLPATAVDLTFDAPAFSGSPTAVDLTFGSTSGPPPGTVYTASLNARFVLSGSVAIGYDTGQWRGLQSSTTLGFQRAREAMQTTDVHWAPGAQALCVAAAQFDQAAPVHVDHDTAWSTPTAGQRTCSAAWDAVKPMGQSASTAWRKPIPARRGAALPWQLGAHRGASAAAAFDLAKPVPRSAVLLWQQGQAHQAAVTARMNQAARRVHRELVSPWQQGLLLASYGGPQYLPPPPVIQPPRQPVVVNLRFCAVYPAGGHPRAGLSLVFGVDPCMGFNPTAPLFVLPARFYMAVHDIQAILLDTGYSLPIFDLELSADEDSTQWTFTASTPFSSIEELIPVSGPKRQVRLLVDGLEWIMLIDGGRQSDKFGGRGAVFRGRSVTALAGGPAALETARLNTSAHTAQQLALDALQFTGIGLDWGITDWLVPAGAWSHFGTPLAAVQAIAQAAGGYINSHRSLPQVLVRHPYPTLPGGIPGLPHNWEGAAGTFAADVELASLVCIDREVDRADGPDINGVWVAGTTDGGMEAHVRMAGTLGDKLAPMETDPLITAVAAATQRGYSILGRGGPKHLVQMRLPVLTGGANPGVLDVGQLIQVNDAQPWRGRVRAVKVNYTRPTLRQSVRLERHLS